MILGSHVNMRGNEMFLGSVKEALTYKANALMIYTGAPQNTRRKKIEDLKISEAHDLLSKNNIALDNIVVHAPYIMNLANPNPDKTQFAIDFLTNEIIRTSALGVNQIVLHPGAHVGTGKEEAITRISKGLNEVINNTRNLKVKIALETMAGKGTEIGKTFTELKEIIDGINDNERISICFDTCHTHDAGYNIRDDFDQVIEEFDKIIGKDKISVFHINDSKNIKGARKDRHANIGFGHIGFKALNYIVHYHDFTNIPKILETPYIKIDDKKSQAPYLEEIENFHNQEFNKTGVLTFI